MTTRCCQPLFRVSVNLSSTKWSDWVGPFSWTFTTQLRCWVDWWIHAACRSPVPMRVKFYPNLVSSDQKVDETVTGDKRKQHHPYELSADLCQQHPDNHSEVLEKRYVIVPCCSKICGSSWCFTTLTMWSISVNHILFEFGLNWWTLTPFMLHSARIRASIPNIVQLSSKESVQMTANKFDWVYYWNANRGNSTNS